MAQLAYGILVGLIQEFLGLLGLHRQASNIRHKSLQRFDLLVCAMMLLASLVFKDHINDVINIYFISLFIIILAFSLGMSSG